MLSGLACRRPLDGELLKVEPPAFCLKPSQQQVCSLTTAQLMLAVLACFHSLELPCCMTKTVSCWWRPVWAREHCRISPPRFLAECCKRQLNQGSFVLLYFRLFSFSDLYWVCLSVFSCTVLFVSISQVIGCEDRLRNDLYCVECWWLRQCFTHLTALCPGLPGWAGTRKVNQSGFHWSKRQWVAVASAWPYASLHLAPDR